jgi:DNA-binding NarL/FixJ family response regulator
VPTQIGQRGTLLLKKTEEHRPSTAGVGEGKQMNAVSGGEPSVSVARVVMDLETPATNGSPRGSIVRPSVVVVDVLRSNGHAPGLLVGSLAEIAHNADFEVSIVSSADARPARKETERIGPSVVLLPIYLVPTDGRSLLDALALWDAPAALCEELTKQGNSVVAVMSSAPAALLAACVAHGAIGLTSSDDLLRTLDQLEGAVVGSGDNRSPLHRVRIDQPPLPGHYNALISLTSTERRTLNAMMLGWSASDIAESLVVSVLTVRTHIRSILAKLNVSSQIAAVAIGYGVDSGEVPIEQPDA